MHEPANRVAFVVAGTHDQVVVDALSRRVWEDRIGTHVVRLGGSAAVPWIWATVLSLLDEKHYAHVILVLDTDTVDPQERQKKREWIETQMRDHNIGDAEVSLVMAVPVLEAWLLADSEEDPEQMDARARYAEAHGGRDAPDMEQIAKSMDLERAASRSPSLREFLSRLEQVEQALSSVDRVAS